MESIKIEKLVTFEISPETIEDLYCTACEGGSFYWCNTVLPMNGPWVKHSNGCINWLETLECCGLVFTCSEDYPVPMVMLSHSVKTGLEILAKKYPNVFQNIVEDGWDANDADCFIQCCLFGEVRYG
jgi:hypothetical protein